MISLARLLAVCCNNHAECSNPLASWKKQTDVLCQALAIPVLIFTMLCGSLLCLKPAQVLQEVRNAASAG